MRHGRMHQLVPSFSYRRQSQSKTSSDILCGRMFIQLFARMRIVRIRTFSATTGDGGYAALRVRILRKSSRTSCTGRGKVKLHGNDDMPAKDDCVFTTIVSWVGPHAKDREYSPHISSRILNQHRRERGKIEIVDSFV